jgi:SAM-dependent methyltransferase
MYSSNELHLKQTWNKKWELEIATSLNENRVGYLIAFRKYVHDISNKSILEIGAGSAILSSTLKTTTPSTKSFALDYSKEALSHISEESDIVRIHADAFHIPLENDSMDICFTEGLLEHYPEKWKGLIDEQYRVTKVGGLIINSVPNVFNFPRTIAYYIQGPSFRYFPAPPFAPRGSIYKYYQELGIEILGIEGWAPFYPAKTMYKWDIKNNTRSYPLYTKIFKAMASLLEPIYLSLNPKLKSKIDKIFGWEFMIIGRVVSKSLSPDSK